MIGGSDWNRTSDNGFADRSLNHLGTEPCNASYNAAGRAIAGTENALTVHPHMLYASTILLMFVENSYDISCTSRINSHGQNPIAASQILLTTASTPLLSTYHCNHLLSVFIYQGNCCKICNSSTVQLSCITGRFNSSVILNTWAAQLLTIWKQFIL